MESWWYNQNKTKSWKSWYIFHRRYNWIKQSLMHDLDAASCVAWPGEPDMNRVTNRLQYILLQHFVMNLLLCKTSYTDMRFSSTPWWIFAVTHEWITSKVIFIVLFRTYSWDCWTPRPHTMMTSSNGNIFRVTGPLYGEFTDHRWIPFTKAI